MLIKLQNGLELCNIIHRTPGQRVGGTASVVTASRRGILMRSVCAGKPVNLEIWIGVKVGVYIYRVSAII